jgi:hypothetical protein
MLYIEWYDYSEESWRMVNTTIPSYDLQWSIESAKRMQTTNPTSRYRIVKVMWES